MFALAVGSVRKMRHGFRGGKNGEERNYEQ